MNGLERVVSAAIDNQFPVAVNWNTVHEPTVPWVRIRIYNGTCEIYFSKGERGWRFKSAVTQVKYINTLQGVLDLISEEGQRRSNDTGGTPQ